MKNILIILAIITLSPFMVSADPPSSVYKLVHSDDFNDNATNLGDEITAGFPLDNGNVTGTCSWPITANVDISNGALNARVKYEVTPHPTNPAAGYRWFSAGDWHTFITFRYGYFEAKIKVTQLDHVWGAFWLLKSPGIGPYQEIDIMEFMTANPVGSGNLSCSQHWWQDQGPNAGNTRDESVDYGDVIGNLDLSVYHTYGCEWTPSVIKFYIDGNLWCTMNNDDLHDPMHIRIGMGRQKEKIKVNDITTIYSCGYSSQPSTMIVDYLKVYQIPGNTPDGLYTKGVQGRDVGLNSLTAVAPASTTHTWGNMLHMAYYPQATYTVLYKSSSNISVTEIGWAISGGSPYNYNYRGELTKGFTYACNVPGTYQVTIRIAFPPGYGYTQDKTFTITILPELEVTVEHQYLMCIGSSIITNISSNDPLLTLDSYTGSWDGVTWGPLDLYTPDANNQYAWTPLTRAGRYFNDVFYYQYCNNTNHPWQVGDCVNTFPLIKNKTLTDHQRDKLGKLDKMVHDQEATVKTIYQNVSNVIPETKLEDYKTLIYNVSGQLIKTCETNQNQVRNFLTEFSSGMYFIHQFDKSGKKISTFKISWVQ